MKYFLLLLFIFSCSPSEPQAIYGCTSPTACNYSSEANEDDGSCAILDCQENCGGGAYIDPCGYCDTDPTNDCAAECPEIMAEISILDEEFQCVNEYNEDGHYCNDLAVILQIMKSNPQCIHRGMDADANNIITVYEYGEDSQWVWAENGRLISLDLTYDESVVLPAFCNFRLTSLPDNIGDLSELEKLSLKNNALSVLPQSISYLTNLQQLILEKNYFSTLPDNIGDLQNLKILYAHHNLLVSLPNSFTELDNLELLWMQFNNLEYLPENIGNLSSLEKIYLNNNNLTILPESIGSFSDDFYSMRLDYNELSSLPESICQLGDNPDSLTIYLTITNNLECPDYPGCVEKIIGYQQCSDCPRNYLIGDGTAGFNGDQSECLDPDDWDVIEDIIDSNPEAYFSDVDGDGHITAIDIINEQHWMRTCGVGTEECTGFNRLMELILNNEGLSGEIPVSIGNLDSLKIIQLNTNQLIGEIPETIGQLTNLEEIKLNMNNLIGDIPVSIGMLTKLEALYLNNNHLGCYEYDYECVPNNEPLSCCLIRCEDTDECSGEIPQNITHLDKLKYLYLNENYLLRGPIPDNIGNLESLQVLRLNINQIEGEIPESISNLSNMKRLYIANNHLSGEIPLSICNLDLLIFIYNNNYFCPPYPDSACATNIFGENQSCDE